MLIYKTAMLCVRDCADNCTASTAMIRHRQDLNVSRSVAVPHIGEHSDHALETVPPRNVDINTSAGYYKLRRGCHSIGTRGDRTSLGPTMLRSI